MNVTGEVKALARSKWFYLAVGVMLGGTILAGIVGTVWAFARGKFSKLTGRSPADAAAAAQQNK